MIIQIAIILYEMAEKNISNFSYFNTNGKNIIIACTLYVEFLSKQETYGWKKSLRLYIFFLFYPTFIGKKNLSLAEIKHFIINVLFE